MFHRVVVREEVETELSGRCLWATNIVLMVYICVYGALQYQHIYQVDSIMCLAKFMVNSQNRRFGEEASFE